MTGAVASVRPQLFVVVDVVRPSFLTGYFLALSRFAVRCSVVFILFVRVSLQYICALQR